MTVLPGDAVWYRDPKVLFRRPAEFFPSRDQTSEEKVNAIVRLSFYIGVGVMAVSYGRTGSMANVGKYVFMAALAAAVVTLAYKGCRPRAQQQQQQQQQQQAAAGAKGAGGKKPGVDHHFNAPKAGTPAARRRHRSVVSNPRSCVRSTPDNPFGNVLLTEYGDDPHRPEACAYDTQRDAVRANFNKNFPRNLTDVYEVENSQRQFMTMPVTTGIPDTAAFADFVYGSGLRGCKYDNNNCTGNEV
jgi:hypothetical protein